MTCSNPNRVQSTNPHPRHSDDFRPRKSDWRSLWDVGGIEFVRDPEYTRYGRGGLSAELVTDTPLCGDRWSYGTWDNVTAAEATHIVVCGYSDYSGSSCDRANYEYLTETYPRSLITVYGGHGTSAVMIPVTSRNPHLFRDIAGLASYPLIDEERHSELEMREATEAWDQFLRRDVLNELSREGLYGIDDVLAAIEESDGNTDHVDNHPVDTIRDWYYESLSDQNESPYLETATDIVFPCHAESMEFVTGKLWQWRAEEFAGRLPAWFNPDQAVLDGMPPHPLDNHAA